MILFFLLFQYAYGFDWDFGLGFEKNEHRNSIIQLGLQHKDMALYYNSDTLALLYRNKRKTGRSWAGLRGEYELAGLIKLPWENGNPVYNKGVTCSYYGVEGGHLRYFRHGIYAGGQGFHRKYVMGEAPEDPITDLQSAQYSRLESILGLYQNNLHIWTLIGGELRYGEELVLQPHIYTQLQWSPSWLLAPKVLLYGGLASQKDAITRQRIGGLNPYVIPIAGAGWGEWWAEDYIAFSSGPKLEKKLGHFRLLAFGHVDGAYFDQQWVTGFGQDIIIERKRWKAEFKTGYAPWIPRGADIKRSSIFFMFSRTSTW